MASSIASDADPLVKYKKSIRGYLLQNLIGRLSSWTANQCFVREHFARFCIDNRLKSKGEVGITGVLRFKAQAAGQKTL